MTTINTDHLAQCIKTLEYALNCLNTSNSKSIDHDVFRNAVMKSFEFTLETSEKLLRKALKTYIETPHLVDGLTYKELFRHATKHGLLDTKSAERWFGYRDNCNNISHDYGITFIQAILKPPVQFLIDAKQLQRLLEQNWGQITLHLDPKYLSIIQTILNTYIPDKIVWVYGSRIKGRSHEGSDLDLVVISDVSNKQLSALQNAFSESNLPILVNVLEWSILPESFKSEIENAHEVFQEGSFSPHAFETRSYTRRA